MKKKVFLILSSLCAGGSERVFWLLSQHFNKSLYDIHIVLLTSKGAFFSLNLNDVNVIDLKTTKASRSFLVLYRLIKREKPYAVFTTGGQINMLVSFLSYFIKVPFLIARSSNIPHQRVQFGGRKAKVLHKFLRSSYQRFGTVVCQSEEIKQSLADFYNVRSDKLTIIPNPVQSSSIIRSTNNFGRLEKKLIIVARLVHVKGHFRLLDTISKLPSNYTLSIAGEGPLMDELKQKAVNLRIDQRVNFLGQASNVLNLIAEHDLLVLSSYTEGFPNVVLEALSVGTPAVTFRVGGVSSVIKNGFNGFVVEQNDLSGFKDAIIAAANKDWNSLSIKNDVYERFGVQKVVSEYEKLIQ